MPPPLKIAKLRTSMSEERISEILKQAVISDDASCQELFQQIKENANMKDITNGLIKTCHENKSVVLSNIILDHIKEYFTLLGVDSAIERFNECSQFIIEGVESGNSRNVVVLLCYFLKNVNVISYEKLRIVIEDKMPVLINVLWESGKRSEACYLAYHFMLILTSECLYLKIDKAPKIWKEKVLRKDMFKSPLVAVLSLLMIDQGKLKWIDEAISPSALDDLQGDDDDDEEICMRNQLTRIVVAYMPSLLTRCNHSQMNSLMTYTVKQYCAKKELATLVRCIDSNPLFIGAHDFIWNIVISSMLNVVQEDLEQCNASRDAAAWIGSLSSMFHEITDGKIEPGGQLPRSTRRLIDKFVTHGGLLTERFKKVECGFFTISVVTAFEYIPLDILDYQRKRLMKITFMLLGTIFYDKYPVVFRSALRGLARLIRLEDPHQLDFAARDLEWLDIFCKQWISTIEKLYVQNDKSMIDLREDMIVILAAALNCTSNGFTVDQNTQPNIMNLGYLECDINSSEVFSEGRIIRLLALFVSSIWTKVAEMDDEQKTRIAFEIKEMSLDRLISNMDFKNAHRRVEFSERWSCMFTIFDHMNRAQRQEWIPRLLKKKQINKLSKAAYRLVSGDHFPIDIQFDNIVVKRAFHFLISTVFDLQLDESFNLSQLINWPCLIRLYAVDLRLVETIASKVPAEKVVEFLSSFTYDAGNSDLDAALCVASTVITPRLSRYSSELLGPFASIFEKCCSCTSILKFAANIVKEFAGSSLERDLVTLSLTTAASMPMPCSHYDMLNSMAELLYNGLRYAYPSINNDQCALYSQLVIKHIKTVQFFVMHKNGSIDERERLVYGTTKLIHQLSRHSTYYNRLIAPIISEIIMESKHTQMAMFKLHTMNDKHSSAMLATNLPAAEKRQYSRVFPEMKKALKPVV